MTLPPMALPDNWGEYVPLPQTEKECRAGCPYGVEDWLQKTVKLYGTRIVNQSKKIDQRRKRKPATITPGPFFTKENLELK